MTGFTIGMIAAGLWLGVAVSIWLFVRASPGDPARSIRSFRVAGRRLSTMDVTPIVPDASTALDLDLDPEIIEIERVIESVTAESSPAPIRRPKRSRPVTPPRPRTIGKLTYVLVDEQGRPEL